MSRVMTKDEFRAMVLDAMRAASVCDPGGKTVSEDSADTVANWLIEWMEAPAPVAPQFTNYVPRAR